MKQIPTNIFLYNFIKKMDNDDDLYTSDDEPETIVEDKDRYELILTKTNRFFIIDLKQVKESIAPTSE